MSHNRIDDLLTEHRAKHLATAMGSRLIFELSSGLTACDVYNISAPFIWEKEIYLLGRVERRDSEHSQMGFFQPHPDPTDPHILSNLNEGSGTDLRQLLGIHKWKQVNAPVLTLQDPFVTRIKNELIVGGVEIVAKDATAELDYRTVFYRGKSIFTLKRMFAGPWGMKDIRLKELADKRILLLTRPQGVIGGRGTIGWTVLSSLSDLNEDRIGSASLLSSQFLAEEWGGANEVHILQDSLVGILAHIARFDEAGNRHYYASSFTLDYLSGEVSPMKIIAERNNFAAGEAKRADLADVIFSGGLIRLDRSEAALYCGAGDAEAHCRLIKDPFCDE